MKKLIVGMACVAVAVVGVAVAKPAAKTSVAARQAPAALRVVALATKSDDVQEMLDVRTWQFDLSLPSDAKSSKQFLVLEQWRKGRAPKSLLRFPLSGFPSSKRFRVFIGLYPPGGGLTESKQVKYKLHMRPLSRDGKVTNGLNMSDIIANPFDGMTMTYPSASGAIAQKDGSFLLVGTSKPPGGGLSRELMDDIAADKVSASAFDAALVFALR